jgi:CheY-like chemotaxis protein
MSAGNILIVDDNPTNMKLVSFLLSSKGYAVRTASSADEALKAIDASVPQLILMDIQLPGTDGLTLTRQLRGNPRSSGVVIIAVTAYAMKGDEEKAYAAGCDGYITKPIDTRSLPGTIAEYLAKGRPAEGTR